MSREIEGGHVCERPAGRKDRTHDCEGQGRRWKGVDALTVTRCRNENKDGNENKEQAEDSGTTTI